MMTIGMLLYILEKLLWALVGAAAGVGLRFLLVNLRQILNYLRQPDISKRLSGIWHVYHLTSDKMAGETPFWAHHVDDIHVTRTLKVNGKSESLPDGSVKYRIEGEIDDGEMKLNYINILLPRDQAFAWIDNLLSPKLLHGCVVAKDFNLSLYAAPFIFSREELPEAALNEIVNDKLKIKVLTKFPTLIASAP